jgi:hypothetical protein
LLAITIFFEKKIKIDLGFAKLRFSTSSLALSRNFLFLKKIYGEFFRGSKKSTIMAELIHRDILQQLIPRLLIDCSAATNATAKPWQSITRREYYYRLPFPFAASLVAS